MNRLLSITLFFLTSLMVFGQEVIEIGGPTWDWENSYTSPISIDANSDNSNSHYISVYTSEEIGGAVFIDGISWYKSFSPGYLGGDAELQIYIKHTDVDSIPNELGTFDDELLGANLVYSSSDVSIPIEYTWLEYVLDTGFAYNGSDNLMILVKWFMPGESTEGPGLGIFYSNNTNGKGAMWRGNSFDNLSYFSSPSSGDRPIIRLNTAAENDIGLFSAEVSHEWDGEEPININVYNAGSEILESFTIQSWINGVAQDDFFWSGEILQNDTLSIDFSSIPLDQGLYSFELISEFPNNEADGDISNDSLQFYAYSCDAPLNGMYSVGPDGDFSSLIEISYALNTCGINGDVSFSFSPGIYEGQLSLHHIEGSSVNDKVYFFAENGNSSSVIWEYGAVDGYDNWIVNLDSTSYVSIKDITLHAAGESVYSRLMVIHNASKSIEIQSCQFIGFDHNSFCPSGDCLEGESIFISTVDGDSIQNISIVDNFFKYNSTAVYVAGYDDYLCSGLFIDDNILRDQYRRGIYVEWANAPTIRNTHVRTASSYSLAIDGIEIQHCLNSFEISNSNILVSREGLRIIDCIGNADNYAKVFNNFVYIDDNTCTESGLVLFNSQFVKLLHNTVSTWDDCESGVGALFIGGSNYLVKNNIFNSRNSENAISMGSYYFGPAMTNYEADYNMLSGSPIAYVGQVDYDLEGWQTFSGADDLSFVETPSYIYPGELHLASLPSTTGEFRDEVPFDIDGEPRDSLNPIVGADEIPACTGPMFGTYFIGEDEEFQSIRSAVAQLIACGIDGEVTMRIKSGTYAEQVDIYPIAGASAENRIRFISDSENNADVIIIHEEPQDHVISFTQCAYISFESVTIKAKGRGVDFRSGARHNVISNCVISVDSVFISREVSEALSNTCINMYGLGCDSNLVESSTLNYGLYGVRFSSPFAERGIGNRIIGNRIQGQVYFGIHGKYFDQNFISKNEIISNNDEDYSAIFYNHCNGSQEISQNKIDISGLGNKYGIFSVYADLDTVSNNFIHISSQSNREVGGMFFHNSSPQVIYNSIHIEGLNNDSSYCSNNWISSFANYYNNIFSNNCNGYSLVMKGEGDSDYNQYSTTKGNHIKQYSSFTSFWERNLYLYNYWTDNGEHSIEESANFTSANDLHLLSSAVGGNADPSFFILNDIDDEIRNDSLPDFGADEFGIQVETHYGICEGDSIWIGASDGASSYSWNGGQDSAQILVYPLETTEYFLELIFEGDTSNYTLLVEVSTIELPSLEESFSLCEGDQLTIVYPGDFDSWEWSNASYVDSSVVYEEGLLIVDVVKGLCEGRDSTYINVLPLPLPDLGDDFSLYTDENTQLSLNESFEAYLWSNGSTLSELELVGNEFPLGDTLFWVEVTNLDGCINRDSLTVSIELVDQLMEVEGSQRLTIAPNPTRSDIFIESSNMNMIEIRDIFGSLVYSIDVDSEELLIDIKDLSKGLYIVMVIYQDGRTQERRIIKY